MHSPTDGFLPIQTWYYNSIGIRSIEEDEQQQLTRIATQNLNTKQSLVDDRICIWAFHCNRLRGERHALQPELFLVSLNGHHQSKDLAITV